MKVIASQLRKGNIVDIDGKLYVVLNAESFHPGKGTPTTQVDMRRISDGVKTQMRYKTTDGVERAHVEEVEYSYLYQDGDGFHFMNDQTYDQVALQADIVGDMAAYLQEGMKVQLAIHEGDRDLDRDSAEGDAGNQGNRAGHEGADRVGLVQAGDPVERRAHHGADPHLAGTRVVVMTARRRYVERAKDLDPHARPHFLRKQIVGRQPLRGDALLVGEAAERVERLAVRLQPVRKRIGAEILAPFVRDRRRPRHRDARGGQILMRSRLRRLASSNALNKFIATHG